MVIRLLPHPRPLDAPPPSSISALPSQLDLELYGGDDFALTLTLTNPDGSPIDVSTAAVTAQIRQRPGADIAASFACSGAGNVVTLWLGQNDTQDLGGNFVWDCQVAWPGGPKSTLVAGEVVITPDVTRPAQRRA
jgi:hypothetical protein